MFDLDAGLLLEGHRRETDRKALGSAGDEPARPEYDPVVVREDDVRREARDQDREHPGVPPVEDRGHAAHPHEHSEDQEGRCSIRVETDRNDLVRKLELSPRKGIEDLHDTLQYVEGRLDFQLLHCIYLCLFL